MTQIQYFITNNFKKYSIGLVCDNAKEIKKVYTAVFPSERVMKFVLDKNENDVMLFVHHPLIWDIRKSPNVFSLMNERLLEEFRRKRISIYNLHAPLDNFGEYSTSVKLAETIGIKPEKPFAPYFGGLCGVFGKVKEKTVQELKINLEKAIGHKSRLYDYGTKEIKNNTAAIVAGGGNNLNILEEIVKENINTFVTGVSVLNDYSQEAHKFAKNNKINILGGTHYSTEKFACIKMCKYFNKIGLQSEFIEDEPILEDL